MPHRRIDPPRVTRKAGRIKDVLMDQRITSSPTKLRRRKDASSAVPAVSDALSRASCHCNTLRERSLKPLLSTLTQARTVKIRLLAREKARLSMRFYAELSCGRAVRSRTESSGVQRLFSTEAAL